MIDTLSLHIDTFFLAPQPDVDELYQSCIFDARATDDLRIDNEDSPVCDSLAAFVDECQERRVQGVRWRTSKRCRK